jgi:hypothetical protein
MRNYALSAASFKVNAAIVQLKSIDRQLRSKSTGEGLASSIRASQLADVGMFLSYMDQRHVQLIIEQQANERESGTRMTPTAA